MEKTFIYKPSDVCSQQMRIVYEGDVVKHLTVVRGCTGNLLGISKLVEGMKIDEVISRLQGIHCPGSRTGATSCPDQLSKALLAIKKEESL